jgi:hypothetical protein
MPNAFDRLTELRRALFEGRVRDVRSGGQALNRVPRGVTKFRTIEEAKASKRPSDRPSRD